MLRYKTETRPGLVALYDIRPGNGAGPFLQPRARTGPKMKRVALAEVCTLLDAILVTAAATTATHM